MNQRQQKLIDELVKEFDKLNSSNQKKGRLLDVGAYLDEFNQSEVMRKEIEAYNNAVEKEAQEIFLEEAVLLQNDLSEMGIHSTINDNRCQNLRPSFDIKLDKHSSATIRIRRAIFYVSLPNGERIERTDKFVVSISELDSEFDSIQSMIDKSDFFKSYIRKALQYAQVKN